MLLLILAALQAPPADVPDGDQFLRLITGLHGEIQDISLTCEGVIKLVGPERITGQPPDEFGRKFQTGYWYRQRDSATMLDEYRRDGTPGAEVERFRTSYLRDYVDILGVAPGNTPRDAQLNRAKGASGSLSAAGSAHRILLLWYFRGKAELGAKFEPKGWEDLGGRRCLVVEMDYESIGPTVAKAIDRLWVDLERGGHPLRYEKYRDDKLTMRTDISLARVNSRGRDYWLPVSGLVETFLWGSTYHSEPIYRETYQVVAGSVVLNAGLSDGAFAVTKETGVDEGELASQFRARTPLPEPPPQRTDPEGVRERLEAELAEADRQAAMLQASAPSRDWWSWTGLFQSLGLAAGIALLTGAFVLRRRFGG
jgi:hypothetical protein